MVSTSIYKLLLGATLLLGSTSPPQKPQPRRLARLVARRASPHSPARCLLRRASPSRLPLLTPPRTARHRGLTPPQPRRRAAAEPHRIAAARLLPRAVARGPEARSRRAPTARTNGLGVSPSVYKGHIRPLTRVYKQNVGGRLRNSPPKIAQLARPVRITEPESPRQSGRCYPVGSSTSAATRSTNSIDADSSARCSSVGQPFRGKYSSRNSARMSGVSSSSRHT